MPHQHGVHFHHVRHYIPEHHSDLNEVSATPTIEPHPTLEPADIVRRSSEPSSTCSSGDKSDACQKSTSSSLTTTLPVVLGVVIPVVCAIVVLLFLHRRHVRKLRAEDANDKHKSLDFGMEIVRGQGKGGHPEMGEKPHKHGGGMSLDIGASPYLLPPGLHGSKESLRSLSKVISADDDKYRLAAHSDNASIRSYPSHPKWGYDDTSSAGGSTRNIPIDDMHHGLLTNASNISRSSPPTESRSAAGTPRHLEKEALPDSLKNNDLSATSTAHSSLDTPKYNAISVSPVQEHIPSMESRQESIPEYLHGQRDVDSGSKGPMASDPGLGAFDFGTGTHETPYPRDDMPKIRESSPESHPVPIVTPRISLPLSDAASDYGDEPKFDQFPPVNVSSTESHTPAVDVAPPPKNANRLTQNFASLDDSFDPRRLTVGIRPLPPEDPSDNAEQRANRIRSFYKEYFEDTKGGSEEYYEDFGPEFYEDPAVYDPHTGEYLVGPPKPFAQPMGRRAMTPPPRFQGPPRQMMHSAAGFRGPGPRAFSSASGRLPGARGPRKPIAPPEPLHMLPSPHLIKDDMSILPIDYAPGKNFKDQREGRPETPQGGLRPYTPAVAAHSPLMSSFDDLAAIPSPHALRKSGVYMPLDFAPPPRFKDKDTNSDAGSIRSNRTGISATHLNNIRAGAYRVSRLPADTVGTRDDIQTSLRPKWDMR
ncbi:hypothetical protein BGW36DRAFT_34747 [Talaromyces proteolyticus]|uniref:Uncharacterized protein n=1 Tax=Talaromyces proteolyticus TaxID=1131652 RepID=A0AAD4KPJ7_9EURO|nr:uncharacterized protein BGW36DRAFT_34747 [Talaromyces proteolyticus]KAH8693126.1 hypothetical protein BGW36DRAFT_34747 [Talaromyces proteolyticus]